MELTVIRRSTIALGFLLLLFCPTFVYTCGPYADTAVFCYANFPNVSPKEFAQGKLGILLPGFYPRYLIVAYRYLMGVPLTADQQAAALSVWRGDLKNGNGSVSPEDALTKWLSSRKQVPGLAAGEQVDVYAPGSSPYEKFLNCPANAFLSAARTLDQRIGSFGLQNPDVKEWVAGQDTVFENCPGVAAPRIPETPASMNAALRADRAYQVAAAWFYARKYDEATARFDAIARDTTSPWAQLAPYLAARCLIRKASLLHKENEGFDAATMKEAKLRLEKIVQNPALAGVHEMARSMLGFVLAHTDPAERAAQLEGDLMKQKDANFLQDLLDFAELYNSSQVNGGLADWIKAANSVAESNANAQDSSSALNQWKRSKNLPWLIAALFSIHADNADLPQIISAAERIPPDSPAYLTVRYYLARLNIAGGKTVEARVELDRLLSDANLDLTTGERNLLISERQKVARDFADFLKFATEPSLAIDSGMDEPFAPPEQPAAADKNAPGYFDAYVAKIFDQRMPLSMIQQAANSTQLPFLMRRELVHAAWTRAVLLDDHKSGMGLQELIQSLDPPLWKEMSAYRNAAEDQKKFMGLLIVLKNPGLRPYVVNGLPRKTTLGAIDDLRENWWCDAADTEGEIFWKWESLPQDARSKDLDAGIPFPEFESEPERSQAKAELEALAKIGPAPNYLSQQVIDWAHSHPDDSYVPEALHWAIRSTRYGCTDKQTTTYSKAAFDLLHERYPHSEWTARTKYHY